VEAAEAAEAVVTAAAMEVVGAPARVLATVAAVMEEGQTWAAMLPSGRGVGMRPGALAEAVDQQRMSVRPGHPERWQRTRSLFRSVPRSQTTTCWEHRRHGRRRRIHRLKGGGTSFATALAAEGMVVVVAEGMVMVAVAKVIVVVARVMVAVAKVMAVVPKVVVAVAKVMVVVARTRAAVAKVMVVVARAVEAKAAGVLVMVVGVVTATGAAEGLAAEGRWESRRCMTQGTRRREQQSSAWC